MQDVWFYVADRQLSEAEQQLIQDELDAFAGGWAAHGHHLGAAALLAYGQLIIMRTTAEAVASGCSIDKSVSFVREIGQRFGIDFFNRTLMPIADGETIRTLPMSAINEAYSSGTITETTPILNNLQTSWAEFEASPVVPFAETGWSRILQNPLK